MWIGLRGVSNHGGRRTGGIEGYTPGARAKQRARYRF
jgi:hypothetical protein